MLEKLKVSLWDLFTFFVSGVLIVILLKFYLISIPYKFDFANSELISGIFYGVLTYTIGIIFEPISNLLFNLLMKLYEWKPIFKKIVKLTKERDEVYYPKIKQIAIDKYGFTDSRTDYYQIARTYLVQKNIATSYMVFLSRFGFYRNLSIFTFINLFLFPILKGADYSLLKIIIILISLAILHLLLYLRGREFFLYTGNEIYRNFILQHSKKD